MVKPKSCRTTCEIVHRRAQRTASERDKADTEGLQNSLCELAHVATPSPDGRLGVSITRSGTRKEIGEMVADEVPQTETLAPNPSPQQPPNGSSWRAKHENQPCFK